MANKQQLRNSIKIERCRMDLVQGLDDVTIKNMVDHFLSQSFITSEEKNVIQAEKTEQDKARKLLDVIHRKVESQDKQNKSKIFDGFVKCLREHNQSLALTVENADDSVPNDESDKSNILERVKNIDLNEKMLNRILMFIGSGWESVAAELDIDSVKISIAKANNPHSTRNQMFEIFNFWRQRETLGRGGLTKLIKAINYCSVHCNFNMNKILECIEDP
ncbi:domain-containing CRADD [Octopus vulgaris]|uniref:Domain-containing CRADD n=1 Tax=Octopus vulgaris TaxID=6645 RepID=A0AA36BF94_OCTVU|nr:domain-containing CRADD [Octopus vulgaris]